MLWCPKIPFQILSLIYFAKVCFIESEGLSLEGDFTGIHEGSDHSGKLRHFGGETETSTFLTSAILPTILLIFDAIFFCMNAGALNVTETIPS